MRGKAPSQYRAGMGRANAGLRLSGAWIQQGGACYNPPFVQTSFSYQGTVVQVLSSLKDAKKRDRNCQIVRRRGRVYVICKTNPRFKARQGGARNKRV